MLFCEHLNRIFGIAHQNVQALIKIREDWAFLIAQRQGRKVYMIGVDKIMKQKVELKESKRKKEEAHHMKSKKDIEILTSKVSLLLSSSTETDENDVANEEDPHSLHHFM